MKAQTKIGSLWESFQNVLIGYAISVFATYLIGPWFGLRAPTLQDLLGFGLAMTVVSVVRSYLIRRWNEWRRNRDTPPDFVHIAEELAAERLRQMRGEGYGLDHDDEHTDGALARAAAAYAYAAVFSPRSEIIGRMWPWDAAQFKPTLPRRNLIKAGALIIAEIGRRDRIKRRGAQ